MDKQAQALLLEVIGLLGKALDTGPTSRLSPNEKTRLSEAVEKLIEHDGDQLVSGTLRVLVGAELNTGLADKLRQKY
jgi:hypothetical protein